MYPWNYCVWNMYLSRNHQHCSEYVWCGWVPSGTYRWRPAFDIVSLWPRYMPEIWTRLVPHPPAQNTGDHSECLRAHGGGANGGAAAQNKQEIRRRKDGQQQALGPLRGACGYSGCCSRGDALRADSLVARFVMCYKDGRRWAPVRGHHLFIFLASARDGDVCGGRAVSF